MSYGQVTPAGQPAPSCFRHPGTVSYVSCNRCGRPVCPQCQVSAPVGVQCVECVHEANRKIPSQRTEFGARVRQGVPIITYSLIAVNVLAYILQWVVPVTTQNMVLVPALAAWEPWRLITSAFAHSTGSIFHLAMNMYGIYLCGVFLEPRLGRARFSWLYLLSTLGGSLGILLLSPPLSATLGASGALAGLFLSLFVVFRTNKQVLRQMAIVLVLNVVLGFVVSGISWQGHLGGAVVGALAAACIVLVPRNPQRTKIQFLLLGALTIVVAVAIYLSAVAVKWPLS
ncbi:MAG TPA: rhomboid family intramembrane serine protease [Micrococcaceae bacterium]|nr:rhomboid family intramembrane serine protease [Micrococcaceae bacterium]